MATTTNLPPWPLAAEREFWRDVCAPRRHPEWFWWFLNVAIGYSFYMRRPENRSEQWLTDRVHRPLAKWWQRFIERFIDDRYAGRRKQWKVAFELPRNWGKTQMVSIPTPLAVWLEFPNLGWGDGSANIDKAAEIMLDPQRAIMEGTDENAWYSWLYGVWLRPNAGMGKGRRPSKQYSLTHEARTNLSLKDQSLKCWGVRGGITGKHPGGGVMDDPVSEEDIKQEANWLDFAYRHLDSMFFAFAPSCLVGFPHTRYRDEDPAGQIFRAQGVCEWAGDPCPDETIKIRPDGEWYVYYVDCYDDNNHSKCPEIDTTRALWAKEAGNPVTFAAQKRNQPGRGSHQLVTNVQMRQALIHPNELPQSGFLYLNCKATFEDLDALGKRDSVVTAVLQDPRNNGVVYYLEGHGSNLLRIEDFSKLVARLVTKAGTDVLWKKYRLMGITNQTPTANVSSDWFSYFKQYMAGLGLPSVPLISLPRPKGSAEKRVVRAVGYTLDKRFKLVDGAPNVHNVISQLVNYYTVRGQKDDWASTVADAFDDVIYRSAIVPAAAGAPQRRFRRASGAFDTDEGFVFDDDRGIYDTWEGESV
jgi:hypothetical protein